MVRLCLRASRENEVSLGTQPSSRPRKVDADTPQVRQEIQRVARAADKGQDVTFRGIRWLSVTFRGEADILRAKSILLSFLLSCGQYRFEGRIAA